MRVRYPFGCAGHARSIVAVVDHLAGLALGANVKKGGIQDSVCSFFHGTYDTAEEMQAMEETRTE